MKTLTALKKTLLLTLIMVLSFSCNEDDPIVIQQPETISEIAIFTEQFNTLAVALQRVGLLETLNGNGPFTVFAPTNTAFASFLSDNGFTSLDDVPNEALICYLE